MLSDIAWIVNHYPQFREIGARCGLEVPQLLLQSVKKFDREFLESSEPAGSTFLVEESGALQYDDAKALYRRLSRFFAKHGMQEVSKAERKKRGARGAEKRWG